MDQWPEWLVIKNHLSLSGLALILSGRAWSVWGWQARPGGALQAQVAQVRGAQRQHLLLIIAAV